MSSINYLREKFSSLQTEEERNAVWDEAVIACSSVAWNFVRKEKHNSLWWILLSPSMNATAEAIARSILDLAKMPRRL